MKNRKKILKLVFALLIMNVHYSFSQITINNLTTLTNAQLANALVDSLVGNGVTFSNATIQGVRNSTNGYQFCYFTTASTTESQMGLSKGIALTSGNTNLLSIGMATNPAASNSFSKGYTSGTPGEIRKSAVTINDMNILANGGSTNWFNGAILEFDFVPEGDSINFRYVFGGEEYSDNTNFTNYQCSEFNDKFGFLISGPGINDPAGYTNNARNIARLANGSEVGINSVNNGVVGGSGTPNGASYCQSANAAWVQGTPVSEYNGTIAGTAPNGNTDVLIAAQGGLTPGATYHIKLLICDLRDGAYDAIVYIEAGSFTSPEPTSMIQANPSSICNGANTYVVVTTNHGTAPYTYNWSDGTIHTTNNPKDSILVSPSANTNYTVTVTDNTLPTPLNAVSSINITVSSPSLSSASQTNVLCHGLSTGAASVNVSGGTGTYTYSWSHNAGLNNASATGLSDGTYTVSVSDGLSCTDTYTFTITEPASALSASFPPASVTNVLCRGNSTGAASVNASGGTTTYTYNWSHNASIHTSSVTGLSANTYTVTVIDANSCTTTASVTITQPAQALSASIPPASITNVACYGQSTAEVTVSASGGTTAYTYNWSHDSNLHTATASSLDADTYTVTVIDANSCTTTASVTINEPAAALEISSTSSTVNDVLCFGGNTGSASLSVSGGTGSYTYSWSHNPALNSATATTLVADDYTVTVTDQNLCTATLTLTVGQPAQALQSIPSSNSSTCGNSDGSVSVAISGGTSPYDYVWQNYPDSLSNNMEALAAGTYNVTITDDNNCTISQSITVSDMGSPSISLVNVNHVLCHGLSSGSVEVNATGGTGTLQYAWSNSNSTNTITNVSGGSYSLSVTDQNNCLATFSITVQEPDTLTATLSVIPVSCNGLSDGEIYVSTQGGVSNYDYAWSNSSSQEDLTGLQANWYYVTITDQNLCQYHDSIQVVQPEALTSALVSESVTCNGLSNGSIDLTSTGGNGSNTFAWSSGQINEDINLLSGGMYYVTITDTKGCSKVDSVEVAEPLVLQSTFVAVNVTCFGDDDGTVNTTTSGGNGGYTYSWSNSQSTEDLTGLNGDTYYVTVSDLKNCQYVDSVSILEPQALTSTFSQTNVTCNGLSNGSIDLTVNGGNGTNLFVWSNDSTTEDLAQISANTYQVTITDINGCTTTNEITISQPALLVASGVATNLTCYGEKNGSVIISYTGGTGIPAFEWEHDATLTSNQALNLEPAVYAVTITDANNCTATYQTEVTSPNVLVVESTPIAALCHASATGQISSSVSGGTLPYSYLWSNQNTADQLNSVSAGTYELTVIDANGCMDSVTVEVLQPIALSTIETITAASCPGSLDGGIVLTTSGGNQPYQYVWSNSATDEELTQVTYGIYQVTVTDNHLCSSTYSYEIKAISEGCLNIPTAFSPNGDNVNDTWEIEHINLYPEINIEIYNRWGQRVFTYSGTGAGYADVSNQWDGTYNDKPIAISSFVFVLDLKDGNSPIQGIVSIIK